MSSPELIWDGDSYITLKQYLQSLGPVLWLEADSLVDDGIADGAAVTTWRDESPLAANDAVQTSGANKPTLETNMAGISKPCVRFTTGQSMTNSTLTWQTKEVTAFIVFAYSSSILTDRVLIGTGGVTEKWYILSDGSDSVAPHAYRGGLQKVGPTFPRIDTTDFLSVGQFTVATLKVNSAGMQLWDKGTSIGSNATAPDGTWTTGYATSGHGADIACIVVFNKTLPAYERKLVERYLGNKYGIAVAA